MTICLRYCYCLLRQEESLQSESEKKKYYITLDAMSFIQISVNSYSPGIEYHDSILVIWKQVKKKGLG